VRPDRRSHVKFFLPPLVAHAADMASPNTSHINSSRCQL
jgi:hypothetical protein